MTDKNNEMSAGQFLGCLGMMLLGLVVVCTMVVVSVWLVVG